jgi:hypothetical protein
MKALIIALLPILCQVESGNNPAALGDYSGKTGEYRAVGVLQIWKIVVDDVNRIQKKEVFTYKDRSDRQKSLRMAEIYLTHYGKHLEKKGVTVDMEVLSRVWNGGPTGYKKKSTEKYWEKVKKELN